MEAVVQARLIYYISDYDLGDKVTINIDRMGVQYQARIIEVTEVWKEKPSRVSINIGNKIRQKKNIFFIWYVVYIVKEGINKNE